MSTRGSLGYIINNNPVLFYNNYDSYPYGLGSSILAFIVESNIENKWNTYKKNDNYLIKDLSLSFENISPNDNFIKESLFCEYAYIINLDNMTLEFYNGFQRKPQYGNRFGSDSNNHGYFPCRLVGIFKIFDINNTVNKENILQKMDNLSVTDEDDISVEKYFRKVKLKMLNKNNIV